MSDSPLTPGDVAVLVDGDWPEWRAALEDIRREYGDEGVRALLRRLQSTASIRASRYLTRY